MLRSHSNMKFLRLLLHSHFIYEILNWMDQFGFKNNCQGFIYNLSQIFVSHEIASAAIPNLTPAAYWRTWLMVVIYTNNRSAAHTNERRDSSVLFSEQKKENRNQAINIYETYKSLGWKRNIWKNKVVYRLRLWIFPVITSTISRLIIICDCLNPR